VMVTTKQAEKMEKIFGTKVHIENVQQSLDESTAEREKSRIVGDFFTEFPTYPQVIFWLNDQLIANPNVATRVVIGQSHSGLDILGLRLGQDNSKPVIVLHCTIHAREWITTTTCCWIIDSLLNTDPEGPQLTEQFSWYIIPVLNVDGYQYAHTTNRLWRKNRGTNSGSSCIGTDLNRNYAIGFGGPGSSNNPCADTFRGLYAFSAAETGAEENFLRPFVQAGSLVAFVDIHAYGGQFMSPWGYTTTLPPDYPEMLEVMVSCTDALYEVNGRQYDYGSSARVIYVAAGGSDDYTYGHGGAVRSFTIEAYGTSFTPPTTFIEPIGSEIWAGIKQIALDLIDGQPV